MIPSLRHLLVSACLLLAGCGDGAPPKQAGGPILPSVVIEPVKARDVSAEFKFVGRSEASRRVELRARVKGVLVERPFAEGADVKAGAAMFRIDPAEFEANRASANASVARTEAALTEAVSTLARYQELVKRDAASVARFDEAKAKEAMARAEVAAAKAALQKADLDLGYTLIKAPISGRSGRASVDVGNLIGPDSGVLATIVQLDPIYVVFSIGEREYLDYAANNRSREKPNATPRIMLANERLYQHAGAFDLIDNQVDPATGTITVRLSFPNPDRILVPGQFVSVVLTRNQPERRIVIPQVAVQENQSGPFVLVVNAENSVEARPIKTGQRIGTEIVALDGLEAGETIIVDGVQKVRPGGKVKPVMAKTRKAATSRNP